MYLVKAFLHEEKASRTGPFERCVFQRCILALIVKLHLKSWQSCSRNLGIYFLAQFALNKSLRWPSPSFHLVCATCECRVRGIVKARQANVKLERFSAV